MNRLINYRIKLRAIQLIIICSGIVSLKAQVINDSLLIDRNYRTFHFNLPESMKPGASLIFILHGSGGNGIKMMNLTTKLQQEIKDQNVILSYPDGYKNFWNECRKAAGSAANIENIDENTFFNSMIEYFARKYQIDRNHVFAIGTSGGGHMAYKLALTEPEKFRAVTAVVANLPDTNNIDCAGKNKAISIMIINGTKDEINPYNGGPVILGNLNMGDVRSTERTFKYWSSLAGYKGDPVKETLPDTDPADGKTIERYTYNRKNMPEVILLKVIGGTHGYPNDIDVHVEAWNFFKKHMGN
ncbi:MAG: prolyl oligopeptidase family serine peptidase [Ferruginibacter sp.]